MAKTMKKTMKKTLSKTTKAGGKSDGLKTLADLMGMDSDEFANTVASKSGGRPFEVGRNQSATIVAVNVSDTVGFPQISYQLKGRDETEGHSEFKNDGLGTPGSRSFARREMEAIGLIWPSDPREIGEAVAPAEGLDVVIDVAQDKREEYSEYTNIYFRDVVATDDAKEEPEADAETDAEPEEASGDYTAKDLDKLGRQADKADEDAIDELSALTTNCDLVPDDYETWADLADAIKEESGI